MRVRLRTAAYEMEYEGPAFLWNDVLRPLFGGPAAAAPGRPESAPRPAAREAAPSGPSRTAEAEALYTRLARIGGRRGEKDAVLVAVWEHDGARRDVGFGDVARSVHAHEAFRDVRVKPHILKHVNRSHMLDTGASRETVRLTDKGRRYVESLER